MNGSLTLVRVLLNQSSVEENDQVGRSMGKIPVLSRFDDSVVEGWVDSENV
ncbi:MAG: hypothetical protein KAG53_05460 [Endozoicomonadaceae bacterium]|nr:hypothetical protein [Endozoicomonadaceae bacterium]